MNIHLLSRKKELLIRQCELDRQKLSHCFDELDRKTSWTQLAITGGVLLAPKMKLLIPVLTFIVPKFLASTSGKGAAGSMKRGVAVVIDLVQKALVFNKGLKILPQLLPWRFKSAA